jgi:sodium-coupled neutral amino acid transporter 11
MATASNAAGSVELPNISNSGNQHENNDDDYFNAIMGRNSYTPPVASTTLGNNDSHFHSSNNSNNNSSQTKKLSKPLKKSGIGGASANLVNSIVGAGIIGIPYALKQSGLVAGILLLILVAYLTDKSLKIIVGLASFHPQLKFRDVRTFEDLASYPFGKIGSNFILINMFVMAYGAMVAYLLIIKDTVPHILGVDSRITRTLIMVATSITVMVPLSMQRDMASLAITSIFSVLADAILVGFIVTCSPISETVEDAGGFGAVLRNDAINPTLFIGLGILSTAMACQHSAFIVSGSLENKTMTRWGKVTGFSITLSAILCLILGICGYLGFLENTQGDVLNNFDNDSIVANVARFLLAITMFCTYPMESFVARHVLVHLFHDGDLDGKDDVNHSGVEGDEAGGYFCFNRRQTWTMVIYVMTLIPALFVDDLGPVLSITGSLGGGCIGKFLHEFFDMYIFIIIIY